jgi:hypothetical protein
MDALQLKLKKIHNNLSEVGQELRLGAEEIAAAAKIAAPGDVGTLRQLISVKKIDNFTFEVISGAEYSAFMEFGTLREVQVPAELQEYAAQFVGGNGIVGSGLSAKEAIFEWCRRKGIDKDAWYPIYMKIMRVGVHPHPFFFPAFNHYRPIIADRIKKLVEDLT